MKGLELRIAPGGTEELRTHGRIELRDRFGIPLPEVTQAELASPAGQVIIGMRSGDEGREVPGTRHGYSCARCSAEVRLAPSGQRLAAVAGVAVWCIECFPFLEAKA